MCIRTVCTLMALVLLALAGSPETTYAQLGKALKNRAKQEAAEQISKETSTTESTTDKVEAASSHGSSHATHSDEASADDAAAEAQAVATLKPGEGAWANYDFVPGERPLFVDDFSNDKVGDFPRRLEFVEGGMQLVEWQGTRWLSDEGNGAFHINLPETLPERFTMEFDVAGYGNGMTIWFDGTSDRWDTHLPNISINEHSGKIHIADGRDAEGQLPYNLSEGSGTIRIMADGPYVKLFMNEKRLAQVPNVNLGRSNRILVFMNGWSAESPRMLANIRVMAGGSDLYDALAEDGRVATQGILFDTGSAVIRPESTPTLKEIGEMLQTHEELRLRIEGHTDNTGTADGNQQLSEKRAAAVKTFLETTYAIDASRLEAQGFGRDNPVADNNMPEGRQQNRRVELVRL